MESQRNSLDTERVMSSQSFFWAHVGLAIAIALFFFVGRSRIKEPARLNLRRGSENADFNNPRQISSMVLSQEAQKASGDELSHSRSLNVMFLYNGHNFDAHEVLGVPAGARREHVEAAFRRAVSNSGPESRTFLEAAYKAILVTLLRG